VFALALGAVFYSKSGGRKTHVVGPAIPLAIRSIAVMPPKAMSSEADNASLSLGMADALITRLGAIRKVVVRPTTAVSRYVDSNQDPVAAGRALGVDAVLDGTFQRVSGQVRVTFRLLEVGSGTQLWAGNFDEADADIFTLEDSVSQEVADALGISRNSLHEDPLQGRTPVAWRIDVRGQLDRPLAESIKRSIKNAMGTRGTFFILKLECGGGQIFAKMPYRRCPRNKKNVRGALEKPCERNLHWRRANRSSNRVERARLEREHTRVTKAMSRLVPGYQEELITLDELRDRMPDLRAKDVSLRASLEALGPPLRDQATYLKLAEDLARPIINYQRLATCWQPQVALPSRGFYYPPTLLSNVHPTSIVAQQEIFGPVLAAMTFRTPLEAVELANNTVYGLAACVWSENVNVALQVAAQLKAGVVWVNCTNLFDAACGFGGYRASGFGREGGREGLLGYLQPAGVKRATKLDAGHPAAAGGAAGSQTTG